MIKRVFIVMLGIGLCTALARAGAVTVWTAGTGNWSIASNWTVGEPGADDAAYINNGGTAQITAGNDESCGSFVLGSYTGDSGTIDMTGGNLSVTNYIYVGYEGDGMLNIADGATVGNDHYCFIAVESGSTGAVTVDGGGSTWTNASSLYVGYYGNATLDIPNGGAVSSLATYIGDYAGSTGAVTVDGAGSTLTNTFHLYVGYSGGGTLNITDGGTVSGALIACIGSNSGSTGVVTVDGVGSTWMNSGAFLNVGDEGAGTLNITNGGTVINDGADCNIGRRPGSTGIVTVDGAGSTWTCYNSSSLYVGDEGNGTLNITGGGAGINVNDCHIGYESGSTGEVTVDGAGSTWTNSVLYVGGDSSRGGGDGTLNITCGGAVSSLQGRIGDSAGSTGAVTVTGTGSTWTNSGGGIYSGGIDVGIEGDGTLNITAGGTVAASSAFVGYKSGSTGQVTVDGVGSAWAIISDPHVVSSNLYVGREGAGTLSITGGGLVSVVGALYIDCFENGDSYISMATGGMLALAGDADDSLTEFLGIVSGTDAIRYGDIDILDWDTAGLDYQLAYLTGGDLAGYTTLTMNSGWGDFDLDTDVDDIDIDLLGDAIRTGSAELWLFDISADGTTGGADGVIDKLDLDYLVRFLVETAIGNGTEYGDWNLDGKVDTTDLTRLATFYGIGSKWSEGNGNRDWDPIIDNTDLTILSTYYGFGVPDIVPEPATLSLLAIGAVGLLRRRRG